MNNSLAHPPEQGFETLNLISPLRRAVQEQNYRTPTPIQIQAIPHLLLQKDLLGCAQTGTGKTAAFALPILQRLAQAQGAPKPKTARTLILAPTRELALQIDESFATYGRYLKISRALVFGGTRPEKQIKALRRGVDVLVATPGRLLDLFQQGHVRLDKVEVFVLDEADRMLDMGFLPDIRRIHSELPVDRQTMLFSATLAQEIRDLTHTFLNDPVQVSVTPPSTTAKNIVQKVLFVDRENKKDLLESVLEDAGIQRVLVFTRTKHGANNLAKRLNRNRVKTEAIHGNKSQSARIQALKNFRSGKARVLVATDVASRGLDVDGITHVINFELPKEAESYVHRIGRTARAGTSGVAISFCDAGERSYLRRIEKEINQSVEVDSTHPFHSAQVASSKKPKANKHKNNGSAGGRKFQGGEPGKRAHSPENGTRPSRKWRPKKNKAANKPASLSSRFHRTKKKI